MAQFSAITALNGRRRRSVYNAAERRFSCVVQQRLQELLEGKRNQLPLLRRYPEQPERLGVMTTPPEIERHDLRLPVAEALTWDAVAFVCPAETGGPTSQELEEDGTVVEHQMFATRFPHIVMLRTDRYLNDVSDPIETTWCLQRVQNQRQQTQLNRLLDAANLGLELLKIVRP